MCTLGYFKKWKKDCMWSDTFFVFLSFYKVSFYRCAKETDVLYCKNRILDETRFRARFWKCTVINFFKTL